MIINGEIPDYEEIISGLSCRVLTFGLSDSFDYYASDIRYDEKGNAEFLLNSHSAPVHTIHLGVPGEHNVLNALASLVLASDLQLNMDRAAEALYHFHGTDRRFEYKGTMNGVTIIDDYAHHPTEITATLTASANYPHKTLWCIFQPHTYTRTQAFFHEFAQALTLADQVILAEIYAAREVNTLGISSQDLAAEIQKLGTPCHYFATFEEIEKFVSENCTHGDLLITMGAGDVVNIGENLLQK